MTLCHHLFQYIYFNRLENNKADTFNYFSILKSNKSRVQDPQMHEKQINGITKVEVARPNAMHSLNLVVNCS